MIPGDICGGTGRSCDLLCLLGISDRLVTPTEAAESSDRFLTLTRFSSAQSSLLISTLKCSLTHTRCVREAA